MKQRIDFSGKLEVHYCTICGIKTYDWDEHIETKRHKKLIKDIPYDPIIINSYMGCKYTPCLQYLPKVKWKKCSTN